MTEPSPLTAVAEYLAQARERELPDHVNDAARIHLIDTVAAIVSGSSLLAGARGQAVADALAGPPQAMVVGSNQLVGASAAALANGMAAHADETDDSHAPSLSHPGCAVVPAALAVAEWQAASGRALLNAVAAGYDVGCRVGRALGREAVDLRWSKPSSHALVGTFGAAAAGAVLTRADPRATRHVLSYAAQHASGTTTWQRDVDHVEKAFVFGGSPAHSGVLAALMVSVGCTGVDDAFTGHPNFLDALSRSPQPQELAAELGTRFEICLTNIKRYPVGSPAQAAVQAAEEIAASEIDPEAVVAIDILLPADLANVVNDREMPDINVQYLVAGTLLDRRCSFAMAHDRDRMMTAPVQRLRARTSLKPDESRTGTRSAELRVRLTDGTTITQVVDDVVGTAERPMDLPQVCAKALEVMSPVLDPPRAAALLDALVNIESIPDVRQLREALAGTKPTPFGGS